MAKRRPRLAVVSPFVDKRYGTERYIAEWVSRLAGQFEIHLYSQHVRDLDLSCIRWHKIPKIPGPHVLNYLWWFAGNRLWRAWDSHVRGLHPDLIFSPGINCLDADVVSVHIVFAELLRSNASHTAPRKDSIFDWLRLLHRQFYYRLIAHLENRIYRNRRTSLILITTRTAAPLREFYGREDSFPVLYFGLDHAIFNPQRRLELREAARRELQLGPELFALLLIGNDWENKGLPVLLESMARLRGLPLRLLVVGRDDPSSYQAFLRANSLADRVHFLPPRDDVEFYYSAADAYAGPSKEDVLPLPPAEAMACGVPVIISATCGLSEIITDGDDGLIVQDPSDAEALASKIRLLYESPSLRERLSKRAMAAVRSYTWERNASEFAAILTHALERRNSSQTATLRQDV